VDRGGAGGAPAIGVAGSDGAPSDGAPSDGAGLDGDGLDTRRLAVAFARVLRGAGLDVPVGSAVVFAQALSAVGLLNRDHVYWAGRATLVRRSEDLAAYDRAFASFFLGRTSGPLVPIVSVPVTIATDEPDDDNPSDEDDDAPENPGLVLNVRYSPTEVLRNKDFATCTDEELAEAYRAMEAVRVEGAQRRTRRLSRSRQKGRRPDLRGTVRYALRSGGEPVRRAWLSPGTRPRRVVLLCDVSGSMEPYARALIRFLHVAVVGRGRVEAFTLGTRLTRITRELAHHDPDAALARAAGAVPDWSGGTRLGDGLKAFNDRFGVRGLARGAVVVILSDGWDRGDPAVLAAEMARLKRVAHRVIWVNPLKATPGYAPLTRGMAAALPYVDDFVEGHSLASLETLTEVMAR
ncbi:MAG: VWA domain-containing protein, partial [Acidimicrobiales bacterium]|nr:VWA domain-containing protein [Acidimicrobiales bacterium]